MQARGIFLTVLSAVLYGLNPLFSKTINVGGCNSLTQTFARLAAGIVIFFILLVFHAANPADMSHNIFNRIYFKQVVNSLHNSSKAF